MSPGSRRPTTGLRRLRSGPIALFVTVLIAIAVVGWAGARIVGRDDEGRPSDVASNPGPSHVHGLGVNPADGSLIVATHYGLFRIPADTDEAARIGDSFQDTMGFTVAGPDYFLGSGHPDVAGIRAGQPGRLGLIESRDAGTTWTDISLSGEVDFHGLAFVHDQVYGWDSGTGRFMVSGDRRDWETRSTLDLFGFAVDPDDADHIIGTGPNGLIETSDGGRNWTGLDGPQFVTLSWGSQAGLWGADSGGGVWRRDGEVFDRAGKLVGEPQAIVAIPGALFAAAHDSDGVTGIYRSIDDGRSWDLRYRDTQQ